MFQVLGLAALALFFSVDLLGRVWQLHEDFDEHRAPVKLQGDELKRVQRWILNQRSRGMVVPLPEDKIISKMPDIEEEFTFRLFAAPIGGWPA